MENTILPGTLLLSDPFLKDPNFLRTAVFICEHQKEGSFGFVLNRKQNIALGELIEDLYHNDFPVYYGGPVATNTLHFIHRIPGKISGGIQIVKGVYWGGDFNEVIDLLLKSEIEQPEIRFFLGYSGWSSGQLQQEMDTKSWILSTANRNLLFNSTNTDIWKAALKELDGEYKQMVNYPLDPQLN